jgi:hypothetical protein
MLPDNEVFAPYKIQRLHLFRTQGEAKLGAPTGVIKWWSAKVE